ncbi:MAG: MFS transporter [Chitinophagaceae bacterium]|nr:MFS transporter [Chitinophagaceae bacterium]
MLTRRIGNYRWFIAFLLFAASTINYIDRQIFGLLKPELEQVFKWTETDYSRIVMVFTACYAIGLLFYGRVIDIVGTRVGFIISVSVWSIAAMLHAAIRSTAGFAWVRGLLGIGESGNYPGGIKTTAEWFPENERAIAIGILDSGANVGACVGPILVPFLLDNFGWQSAFLITGSLGFIWLICWIVFYRVPSKHTHLSEIERNYINNDAPLNEREEAKVSWLRLLKLRQTWAFIVGKFFADPIWFFFLFWLPSYFHSQFNLDLKSPGMALALVYAGTFIGGLGGGYFSSWLIKKGVPVYKARKRALLISALLVVTIMATRYITNMWAIVALISISVAANQAWSVNIFTIVPDMFPKSVVSSVTGIGGMAGAIGSVLLPVFVGYILDYYKAAGNIVAGYNIIFIICGTSFMIAWLIIHLLIPKLDKVTFVE